VDVAYRRAPGGANGAARPPGGAADRARAILLRSGDAPRGGRPLSETRDRLLRKGDYVQGSFLKPEQVDGYLNGVNPGDRSDALGRFPFSEANADQACDFAASAARLWRRVPLDDRAVAVRRFREALAQHQEPTARLLTREVGKPLWEARQEVQATLRALDLHLDDGLLLLAPRVIEEIGARSDRMPRGTTAVLAPFAFPLLVPAVQCAAALLAGNSVVLKPSKFTPGVGQVIAELFDRCRLPRGVFNLVQGPGAVIGQRLVAHPQVDIVVFTGNHATHQALRQATLDRPDLPIAAFTGGKGVALVLDDADLDQAVYEVMVGAFLTSGQRHNSTGRVLVTDAVYDAFTAALVQRTERLSVGYGFDPDVFMGPLVSENLRTRYRRYARRLASKGHRALVEAGHEVPGRRGFYANPCIYAVDWEGGEAMLSEEPPGPTLLVYRVPGWEEAAGLHNQCDARLSTSVFTRLDNPAVPELRERLRTGAINFNRGTIGASMRLPSIGLGRCGNGAPGGLELLNLLTHPRSQLVERRPFETLARLPGVRWDSTVVPAPEDETEEDDIDLSGSLELALE
jgi:acyl-CoA reductase-like NAD-dependent aldehyde dehydrogenase